MVQLTYTSGQKGWDIERIFGDATPAESEAFTRVSSQCDTGQTLYALEFKDNCYILMHSAPYGVDVVNRPRNYVHGYLFREEMWEQLFTDYSYLLGADYFAQTENDELLPFESVFNKRFSQNADFPDLVGIVECIYEAILGKKSLEICVHNDDGISAIKRIMFTLYGYLPLVLRKFVTFSSCMSNIKKTVAVVAEHSGTAAITYDLSTGNYSGTTGKYLPFVEKLFTSQKEQYLERVDAEIRRYSCRNVLDEIFYEQIFRDVLPEADAKAFVSEKNLISQFLYFLLNHQYNTKVGTTLVNSFLEDVIRERMITPQALDEKLINVFKVTDMQQLKENIVVYLNEKYLKQNEGNTLDAFFTFASREPELFHLMTEKALATNDAVILSAFVNHFLAKSGSGISIKGTYSNDALTNIVSAMVQMIIFSADREKLLQKLISNELHSEVLRLLMDADAEEEIFWDYFKVVYSSVDAYRAFRQLDYDTYESLDNIFYSIISNYETEALSLLSFVHNVLGEEMFSVMESKLMQNNCQGLLELFYVNFLSQAADRQEILEERKQRLGELGISVNDFVRSAATLYAELCYGEYTKGNAKATDILKKIYTFSGGVPIVADKECEALKAKFWESFSWKKFDFTSDDVRIMRIDDQPKSELANAVCSLAAYLSGKTEEISKSVIIKCRALLCQKNRYITKAEQSRLLKALSKLSADVSRIGLDIYLLINYSPASKKVNFKTKIDIEVIYSYLVGDAGDHDMLGIPGVYDSLYRFLGKKESSSRYGIQRELNKRKIRQMMDNAAGKNSRKARKQFYGTTFYETFWLWVMIAVFQFCTYTFNNRHVFWLGSVYAVIGTVISCIGMSAAINRHRLLLRILTMVIIILCTCLQLFFMIL